MCVARLGEEREKGRGGRGRVGERESGRRGEWERSRVGALSPALPLVFSCFFEQGDLPGMIQRVLNDPVQHEVDRVIGPGRDLLQS